jgi:hypothetical protein
MAGRGRSSGKGNENCGNEKGSTTVDDRTKKTRFGFAKLAAAFVALLLLGVMASSALADGTRSQRSTR